MNVELVSKTVPNEDYFERQLRDLLEKGVIDAQEYKKSKENLDAESLMIYIARVSSSRDNKLQDYEGLLNYLIQENHWSPFQMADMTVEIETSRAMARQMIRHRSFKFQEFSQRYSSDIEFENFELRGQPDQNRQSSSEKVNPTIIHFFNGDEEGAKWMVQSVLDAAEDVYNKLIEAGVASETARMILPECTQTTLYMKGSVRSWLHYLELRMEENTQKEHREVAEEIRKIFVEEFPVTAQATDLDYE